MFVLVKSTSEQSEKRVSTVGNGSKRRIGFKGVTTKKVNESWSALSALSAWVV